MLHWYRILPLMVGAALVACGDDRDDANTTGFDSSTFEVPPEGTALLSFLQGNSYAQFPAESAVRAPTVPSPHGRVRVFLNTTLDQSLNANNAAHPVGSAAVKELYDATGTTRTGWAVSVKTQADSNGGQGWYWYEIINNRVIADGNGLPGCANCHQSSGQDFVSTLYPLQ